MRFIVRYVMQRRIPVLRRLLPSLAKMWAALTWKGGFRIARTNGAYFLVNYKNLVDRHIGLYGSWDDPHLKFLNERIERHGCDIFMDIGANIGYYAILMARNPRVGEVITFEPDIRNHYQLCGNIYLNRLAGKVTPHALAVSNINGSLRFVMHGETGTGGSHAALPEEQDFVEVDAVRLDDFLDISGKTIFIKIDIEDHELEGLEGMAGLLRNNRCLLQIEAFDENAPRVHEFFHSIDYQVRGNIGPDHFFDNFPE